ncbi:hypothetical protein E4Z66_10380 [Aliishimia ponticola]|uniref:Core-binding (CB) domain-containing protein n=1 Tax=Aliishimia ponticola TaxID=2499833 RepID=A0A4V3XKK3_9RHOB|nr:DUF6538 domain-containing protein [Aliishimia ponticola]THH37313.1 hypothetical protein E4Z66_10380 [Aliishimia ponticola]
MADYPPVKLVFMKSKGKYYANMTVPADLREATGRNQYRLSTGTSDKGVAESKRGALTMRMYDWLDKHRPDPLGTLKDTLATSLTPEDVDELAASGSLSEVVEDLSKEKLPTTGLEEDYFTAIEERDAALEALSILETLEEDIIPATSDHTISAAISEYLSTKPYALNKTAKEAETALNEFAEFTSASTLEEIKSIDGYRYADHISATKSQSTTKKKLGYVRGLLSYFVRSGVLPDNAFRGLSLPTSSKARTLHRLPFTDAELVEIFKQTMPKHVRDLMEILCTTGMRLDEAALLDWEDIKEEDGVVFFDLTHRDKRVKNIGSARKVPVPAVLATKFKPGSGTGQIFHQFKRNSDGKKQGPASKACMAVIRKVTDDPQKVAHSFRGNLKDKLRSAGVDKETNDFITGHSSGDVAGTYGSGPSLKVRKESLDKIEHHWL